MSSPIHNNLIHHLTTSVIIVFTIHQYHSFQQLKSNFPTDLYDCPHHQRPYNASWIMVMLNQFIEMTLASYKESNRGTTRNALQVHEHVHMYVYM